MPHFILFINVTGLPVYAKINDELALGRVEFHVISNFQIIFTINCLKTRGNTLHDQGYFELEILENFYSTSGMK